MVYKYSIYLKNISKYVYPISKPYTRKRKTKEYMPGSNAFKKTSMAAAAGERSEESTRRKKQLTQRVEEKKCKTMRTGLGYIHSLLLGPSTKIVPTRSNQINRSEKTAYLQKRTFFRIKEKNTNAQSKCKPIHFALKEPTAVFQSDKLLRCTQKKRKKFVHALGIYAHKKVLPTLRN